MCNNFVSSNKRRNKIRKKDRQALLFCPKIYKFKVTSHLNI